MITLQQAQENNYDLLPVMDYGFLIVNKAIKPGVTVYCGRSMKWQTYQLATFYSAFKTEEDALIAIETLINEENP